MAIEIRQCILTNNDCYRQGNTMVPKGIVVHSTGANNPYISRYVAPDDGILGANKYNNHWNQGGISKCVHAFIGKDKNGNVRIYQTLPWNYRPWGCGSGPNGSYNNSHIQFEICEDALADEKYFTEAFNAAIELCKYLMQKYNITISNVVSHSEAHDRGYASNHGDPHTWLRNYGKSMDWFRSKLTGAVIEQNTRDVVSTPTVSSKSDIDVYYCSYSDGKWNGNIKNYNNTSSNGYSGVENKPIHCVMAKLSTTKGKLYTRVHVKGGNWLPWVNGYDPCEPNNGYAGLGDKEIDGIQFRLEGLAGYKVMYRVSTTSSTGWLDWVNGTADYAGLYGKAIDKLQVYISK